MGITIQLGWWLVPAAITLIVFLWQYARWNDVTDVYTSPADGYFALLSLAVSLIVVMVPWLIWAILT